MILLKITNSEKKQMILYKKLKLLESELMTLILLEEGSKTNRLKRSNTQVLIRKHATGKTFKNRTFLLLLKK